MKKHIVDLKAGTQKQVDPTQADLDEIASGKAQALAEKPMREWKTQIAASDISRDLENVIAAMEAPARARIDPVTLDKYNAKKTLRSQKPN